MPQGQIPCSQDVAYPMDSAPSNSPGAPVNPAMASIQVAGAGNVVKIVGQNLDWGGWRTSGSDQPQPAQFAPSIALAQACRVRM